MNIKSVRPKTNPGLSSKNCYDLNVEMLDQYWSP